LSAITQNDIFFSFSGGNNNTFPSLSLGGLPNVTQTFRGQDLFNIFPDVTPTQATYGVVQHRCLYVWNVGPTTWRNPIMWISQHNKDAPVAEITIANGVAPASFESDNPAVAEPSISSESIAPAGVTFSRPMTKAAGIPLGNIPGVDTKRGGFFKPIWIRRTTLTGTTTLHADYFTITVEGPPS
jgi:hypothetical protein